MPGSQSRLTPSHEEFTERLFASSERQPIGEHELDRLCQEMGIVHRPAQTRPPTTNGMVERFNARISDVLKTIDALREAPNEEYRLVLLPRCKARA